MSFKLKLVGANRNSLRLGIAQSQHVLKRFFAWVDEQFRKQGFLLSSFLSACSRIFVNVGVGCRSTPAEPEVSIDKNHLERALRVIPC